MGIMENDKNVWKDYRDKDGKLLYRLKSCTDTFSYQFTQTDPETGEEIRTTFSVPEKTLIEVKYFPGEINYIHQNKVVRCAQNKKGGVVLGCARDQKNLNIKSQHMTKTMTFMIS